MVSAIISYLKKFQEVHPVALLIKPLSINQASSASPRLLSPIGSDTRQAPDFGPAYALNLSAQGKALASGKEPDTKEPARQTEAASASEGAKKVDGAVCQTCKNRKYQDGSNEANVSFKTPGHIAPENSASAVRAHEQEHVGNAMEEDQQENKKLLSHSVRMYTGTCPECGKVYTAGGETKTVMQTTTKDTPANDKSLGKNVDIAA